MSCGNCNSCKCNTSADVSNQQKSNVIDVVDDKPSEQFEELEPKRFGTGDIDWDAKF